MSQVTKPLDLGPGMGSLAPQQVNALLFYQLAQFVVWGLAHRDLTAAHPDLTLLLQTATMALSRGGVLDSQASSLPAEAKATNPVSDSESFGMRRCVQGENRLDGVVSMPSGVFRPYAGVSTAVLLFTKGGTTEKIWF